MKNFWIGIGLFALGILFGVLVVVTIASDMTLLGSALLILAIIAFFAGWTLTRAAVQELKENLAAEAAIGEKTTKRLITKHIALVAAGCLAVGAIAIFANASIKAADLNNYVQYTLEKEKEVTNIDYLQEVEARVAKAGPLVRNVFFKYADEIQSRKDAYQAAIEQRAAAITAGINALEECTKIDSKAHYLELSSSISKLKLHTTNDFDAQVLPLVDNYDELAQHEKQLETVRAQYRHQCNDCKGNGDFTCTKCSGAGRSTCSSCNGRGKKAVTWYSHGNWGDTSYSSYKCTSCNGSGRKDCGSCSGGKLDCSKCDSGSFYIYEDGNIS